ncbi:MAG: MCE family protein [Deltaproteobacteria bacterium]|nr:MCE family protein [Deltaproteobacteria bacterium]
MAQSFDTMAFKVGSFVLLVVLTAVASVFYIGIKKDLFSETITFYVTTDSGDNIERGIPVRLSGFNIGQVRRVNLDALDHIKIEISIFEKYRKWFREDTRISLEQEGVIGNSYLKVLPGSDASPELEPESTIALNKVGGLSELLTEAQPVMENLKAIVANVKTITDIFVQEDGPVQRILANLETMSSKLTDEQGLIHYIAVSPEPVLKLEGILSQADQAMGQADQAMTQAGSLLGNATARVEDIAPMQKELLELIREAKDILAQMRGLREDLGPTLSNVEALTANVSNATTDLITLRRKSEYTLRLGTELLERLNNTWPLNRGRPPATDRDWPSP